MLTVLVKMVVTAMSVMPNIPLTGKRNPHIDFKSHNGCFTGISSNQFPTEPNASVLNFSFGGVCLICYNTEE